MTTVGASVARDRPPAGHLADNVLYFARLLRDAGLPVGTDRALLALQAVQVAGLESRGDFHATLRACLIDRAEHRSLFDQAFDAFWRDPDRDGKLMRRLLPRVAAQAAFAEPMPAENRRLAEALFRDIGARPARSTAARERLAVDASFTWSDRERLRKTDFESMTTAEWAAARRMIASIEPVFAHRRTRRFVPAARGARLDLRELLRDTARHGGDIAALPRRDARTRPEPIVLIIDISGSMSRYSRMFLQFAHALASGPRAADHRLHVFVFGTRLTHITRQLRTRDPDEAIAGVVGAVDDWAGGTRIARCLKDFNYRWARRVLIGRPTVLLVTDGLELGELELLSAQIQRLARSCRRIIWLNPLLRYPAFEPKAGGIRALLPHVDRVLPVHDIESLENLARALLAAPRPEPTRWS